MQQILRTYVYRFIAAYLAGLLLMPGHGLCTPGAAKGPEAIRISADTGALPVQVQAMHEAILQAARSGDIDMLVPVLEMNELKPTVSFGASEDPVTYWRRTSGDGEGRQVMAILAEILEMPYAHVNVGTDTEMYVWPYLAELSLEKLAPAQQVDLYRLVSPEDVKAMKEFGAYIHYRLGIGPDGTWHYFVAGD